MTEDAVTTRRPASTQRISLRVNGARYDRQTSVRISLADFLRDELNLTGTHVGCEQGVCGSCTVLVDGEPIRGCLMFAVQAAGREITTVEGLAKAGGDLHPIQQAFWEKHALQCGFCTPGFLLTAYDFLSRNRGVDDAAVREALSGNLCRCTGYQHIVEAVRAADQTWER
jgi:aerobic-type carbon monoxide dehydrogenase small subunit (CoxS/CutS family)